MFNNRLIPSLTVVGVVVFFSVCYIGYQEYQKHVEFGSFMTKVQATLDKDANLPEQMEAKPQGIDTSSSATTYPPHPIDILAPPVKVAVISKEDMGKEEPVDMSELPPEVRAKLEVHIEQLSGAPLKPLRIQTPDGNIRVIYVPEGREYKDGDIAVSEETASRPTAFPPWGFDKSMAVQDSDIPERETAESYLYKMRWASALGVSIEEVEGMMEGGAIPQPKIIARSPVEEFIDHDHLFHEHEDLPRSNTAPKNVGGIGEDTDAALARSDVPVYPSDVPDMVKSTPSPPSVADIKKQLTPEGIEAELSEGGSTDRFDKAQQLIDQYGTKEGLRRLQEMDPEAARRFERERPSNPDYEAPKDDGYSDKPVPDDSP